MVHHLGFYECYMFVFIHAINAQMTVFGFRNSISDNIWPIICAPYNMGCSRGFEVKNKSRIPGDIGLQYRVC